MRTIVLIRTIVVGCILILFTFGGCDRQVSVIGTQRSFNSQEWLGAPSKRHEMVNDLIRSQVLRGLSKEAVQEKLGSPELIEPATSVKGMTRRATECWFYELDRERFPEAFDCAYVVVVFGKKNEVLVVRDFIN
jgi:hypothetical protein